MKKHLILLIFSFNLAALWAQQPSPGGIDGAWQWWRPQSTNTQQHYWQMGAERLPYAASESVLLNHWPSPNWLMLSQPPVLELSAGMGNAATLFIVYQPPADNKEEVLWSWQRGNQPPLVSTNKRLADLQKRHYLNFLHEQHATRLQTYRHAEGNTQEGKTLFGFGQLTTPASIPAGQWAAPIAEFIFYPYLLEPTDQLQVESYLALKYGTTLGTPGQGFNYLSSTGLLLWEAEQNQDFHHRIFGLGRDDASGWQQGRSHSAEAPELVSLSLSGSPAQNGLAELPIPDQHFCLTGDNAAALEWIDIADADGEVLDRKWLVQFTGNFSEFLTDIQFDLGRWLDSDVDAFEYSILVDADASNGFQTAEAEHFTMTSLQKGRFGQFEGIHWPSSTQVIFTLARRPIATSQSELAALRVYPNPLAENKAWQWQLRLPNDTNLSVQLTNAKGQQLWQSHYPTSSYFAAEERPLPVGIYLLSLSTNTNTFSQKIVVQ